VVAPVVVVGAMLATPLEVVELATVVDAVGVLPAAPVVVVVALAVVIVAVEVGLSPQASSNPVIIKATNPSDCRVVCLK
jgi:hypothetical protein